MWWSSLDESTATRLQERLRTEDWKREDWKLNWKKGHVGMART
jgi:hypothetical protein